MPMPLSQLVQDVRELYLGKIQPSTSVTCNAMSPRVILIRLTQKYIEKYTMMELMKNESHSDEEESWDNEWNMNLLEPVVEISDKPKENSRKRRRRPLLGMSRKRHRPMKARESEFTVSKIKQELSESVLFRDMTHNASMTTMPLDTAAALPMYEVPGGNIAVYVPQPQPIVLQHTVDNPVQTTNNLLIDQPENAITPCTSDNSCQDIHSEMDLAGNIKQEQQMEKVFVIPFGTSLGNEDKVASENQHSDEPDIIECDPLDNLARKNRADAIAASMKVMGTGTSSHQKLKDLSSKLVELNNKSLQCDTRIEKIKDEFKKRLEFVEVEKQGIEQEIDQVLSSIQNWKDAKRQTL